MRTVREGHSRTSSRAGSPTRSIPIALAYLVAHYFSPLLFQGQALGYLASDPLGDGSDLLRDVVVRPIDYALVGATAIWYVQVAALVTGHVAGLVLAHDRALVVYRQPGDATRSQVWMLAVMVALHLPRPLAAVGGGMSAVPARPRRPLVPRGRSTSRPCSSSCSRSGSRPCARSAPGGAAAGGADD